MVAKINPGKYTLNTLSGHRSSLNRHPQYHYYTIKDKPVSNHNV